MPKIEQVLKQEIQRLARKEAKNYVSKVNQDAITLKRTVADLKKRIARLERQNRQLMKAENKRQRKYADVKPDEAASMRFTAKGHSLAAKKA